MDHLYPGPGTRNARRRLSAAGFPTAARFLAAAGILALGAVPLSAQDGEQVTPPIINPGALTSAAPASVPFAPGEDLLYQVKLGIMTVGEGYMRVPGVEEVRGRQCYRIQMGMEGRVLFVASVRYHFDSWMDVHTLASRRFLKDSFEINKSRYRAYEIYPEEQRWDRIGVDKSGPTISDMPLDEISFVYYVRSLPLEVGDEYVLNHYFEEGGNPVVIKVLRKERKEVPAGTFDTIVIQPIIQSSGLFGQGGKAEIYFSDDEHRRVVYMRSEIPVVGSITLHLKEIR